MKIDAKDRCPKCGVPYQSLCKLGEPDTRICYLCTETGSNKVVTAPFVDNDLVIQPLATTISQPSHNFYEGVRKKSERQSPRTQFHIPISVSQIIAIVIVGVISSVTIPAMFSSPPEQTAPVAIVSTQPSQPSSQVAQVAHFKDVQSKQQKNTKSIPTMGSPSARRSLVVSATTPNQSIDSNVPEPVVSVVHGNEPAATDIAKKMNTTKKEISLRKMVEDEEAEIITKPKQVAAKPEMPNNDELIQKKDTKEELRKMSGFASFSDLAEKPSTCPKCSGSGIAIWLECLNCSKSGQPGFKNMGDYWEACRRCSSKGKIAAVRCNTCTGKGSVLLSQLKPADGGIKDPPKGFQWCSDCSGTGTSVWSDCNQCKRSKYPGYLFFGDRLEVCGRCNGAGKFPSIACGKCNHKGLVREDANVSKNAPQARLSPQARQ